MMRHGDLEVCGDVQFRATDEDIVAMREWLPIKPPRSYVEFVQDLGHGSTGCFFTIWVPTRDAPNECQIRYMTPLHKAEIDEIACRAHLDATEQFGGVALRRLIPFGTTDNGDYLTWDPTDLSPSDEPAIVVVGTKGSFVETFRLDLWALIKFYTAHPDLDERLPAVFVPYGFTVELQRCTFCGSRYANSHACSRKGELAALAGAWIRRLVDEDAIAISDSTTVETLASDVPRLLIDGVDGSALADWLLNRDEVDEVYADDDLLDERVEELRREFGVE